ncbi:MAG TPA: hypothetical protein ENJ35_06165 [Gammaproteobacteria bacterium]|nr:hypothetical protein [Gammaproteobacteria bacterium]
MMKRMVEEYRMTKKLLLVATLMLFSTASQAWELQYYAGFGMGQGFYTKDGPGVAQELGRRGWTNPDVSMKDSTTVWKAYWGTYFTPFLGLQLGYANLGNADVKASAQIAEGEEAEFVKDLAKAQPDLGKGVQLSVTGRFPVSENITVHDWLGVFVWENESSAIFKGKKVTETTKGTNFVLGAAAEYRLNYELGFRLEFERFNQRGDAVNVLGGSVAYYF